MNGIEQFVFYFGAIVLILIFGIIASLLVVLVGCFVKRKVERYKRLKRTTRKCERFGLTIAHAPVRRPGCSWGVEKKEGGDD